MNRCSSTHPRHLRYHRRNPDELGAPRDLPREIYVEVAVLPPRIRAEIRDAGYRRSGIAVHPSMTYTPRAYSNDGERSFVIAIGIESGFRNEIVGSWGGGSYDRRQVDLDSQIYQIPRGAAVIQGYEGGGQPVGATVLMHPDDVRIYLASALRVAEPLASRLVSALGAISGYTSAYRVDYFASSGLGKYGPDNAHVRDLAARGLVSIAKNGAIRVTIAGKSALAAARHR